MQCTMVSNRMFWCGVLLLLFSVRPSQQESTDDVANAIGQLKNLIDSRLTSMEAELNKINTRLDSIDQDIALMKDSAQLLFNPQEITSFNWSTVSLTCGVVGTFKSCDWENNNHTYQLDDVLKNMYPDLSVESNTAADQQCGITIKNVNDNHAGSWTCRVLTSSGNTLSATKNLTIIPSRFEVFGNHAVQVPKKTDNRWSTDKRITYQASLERCTKMGASPFIPRTKEDFDFMVRVTKTRLGGTWESYMWFPATDIDTEGALMWADNTDATASSVIKWCNNHTLEGNQDNYDCAQINSGACSDTVDMDRCGYDAFPMICELLP